MPATRHPVPLPERYRPVRHIANGGMAAVWAAQDTVLRREVAVKLLAPELAQDSRARARFEREARTAASLSDHPNAITIYDVGEHDGASFIVMESLPGGSLADRIRGGRVPREQALTWLEQAADALDVAHERGIVHRDVKPANMLFDGHGRLILADFGIARLAFESGITTTGELLGTAAYVSPEQVSGRPATPASDRYSLAVVAYELLTGTRPFRAEHFAATAHQHVERPPDPATSRDPSLPAAVDAVLDRGLAKEPDQRFPTASAMVSALRRAVETPPPLGRATASRGPHRWRLAWVIPVALLAIAALAAVAVVLAAGGRDGQRTAGTTADRPAERSATPDTKGKPSRSGATSGESTATSGGSGATSGESTAPDVSTTPARSSDGPATSTGGEASISAGGPAALNATGFSLMNQGRYRDAVAVLQRAVDACGGKVDDLTCAYATFNLGRSLRLAGRPAEAVPVLERRLGNPDQRETVQTELDAAKAAAGGS